jgi:hypothetical protein
MRHFDVPSYFVTFTANPKGKEVQDESFPGTSGIQHHDIIVHVFKMKLDNFPKEFYEEIVVREEGYPNYRRRPSSRRFKKNINGRKMNSIVGGSCSIIHI